MKSKKDDRYFIPALAVIDFMGSAFASTFSLVQNVRPVMFPGSFSCKFLNYGTSTFIIASLVLLLIISIQRYQKICRPFGFQMSMSVKRLAIFLTFLIGNILSIPVTILYQTVGIRNQHFNGTGTTCGNAPGMERFGDIYRGIIIFAEVLAIICMSFLYVLVGRKLFKQFSLSRKLKQTARVDIARKEILNNNASDDINTSKEEIIESSLEEEQQQNTERVNRIVPKETPRRPPRRNFSNVSTTTYTGRQNSCTSSVGYENRPVSHSARRYSLMFMVISLVAILCFIPPWILILLESKNDYFWNNLSYSAAQACSVIRRLYIVNHIANPFIYGFFDSKFRHEIKRILCRCLK
ncbi:hypothetical protein FSP39_019928 [Pinctada imbricata]|uniref:G-protein coupled receptors family 1 profile domain-containing protein n=1 Tax=Pinctada imbricata TaxID=66713 RepID=A0AA88YNF6_PINIB|nr:hypothetical protein FSP39_019928 [Pinctada imbricata]